MYLAYRQPVRRDIVAHYPRIHPACQWRISDPAGGGVTDLGRRWNAVGGYGSFESASRRITSAAFSPIM
jgi:hypothetical protein